MVGRADEEKTSFSFPQASRHVSVTVLPPICLRDDCLFRFEIKFPLKKILENTTIHVRINILNEKIIL
jgi:hypothetical protein